MLALGQNKHQHPHRSSSDKHGPPCSTQLFRAIHIPGPHDSSLSGGCDSCWSSFGTTTAFLFRASKTLELAIARTTKTTLYTRHGRWERRKWEGGDCLQTDTDTVYRQTRSILPSFQQGKQGEGNREGTATLLKSEWASLRPEHQIPRPPEIQTSSHLCCFYTHKSGTALVETA